MFFPNLLSTRQSSDFTLLHLEQPKLHGVMVILSVIGLNNVFALVCGYCIYFAGFANIGYGANLMFGLWLIFYTVNGERFTIQSFLSTTTAFVPKIFYVKLNLLL